jgi:hypothetical protein
VLDSRTMQPSSGVLLALLEPMEEPVEPWVPMPEVPGLVLEPVLWPDCPDMEPLLEVLGDVVLVLGVVVCELEVELWPLLMLELEF